MCDKVVAHFLRKNTQLRSSFIQNQIVHHINYKPVIIYRYYSDRNDGGFAEYHYDFPVLNLSEGKYFDINWRYLKKIAKEDVKKIIDFLDKNDVSILHFHYGSDAYIYTDVMKYSGRPSVVSFYGYDASSFRYNFFNYVFKILQKVFKNGTKMLAMSPDMKNDLLKAGCPEDKIMVHYYGSDVNKFYQNRNFINKEEIEFLIISGLEPQKGHIFLLIAFKKAHQIKKNIRLKIFGSGSIEKKISEYIYKNDMSSYVTLYGPILYGSKKHLDVLHEADIFIHPSVTAKNGDKEGIPGAIVEAMASGLPVISTYHAGIPYVIIDGVTGFLVKEWDIDGLVEAIIHMAEDIKLRKKLGLAAQKFAIENLDLFKKERDLELLYDNLIK